MISPDKITAIFVNHFPDAFDMGNAPNIDRVLNTVDLRVTSTMNTQLLKPYTAADVYTHTRANAILQKHQDLMVCPLPSFRNPGILLKMMFLLNVLNNHSLPGSVDHTYIALVPKASHPKTLWIIGS